MRSITGIFLAALVALTAGADARDTERYLRLTARPGPGLDRLLRSVSVARVRGDTVYAYVGEDRLPELRAQGYAPEALEHPDSRVDHVMASSPADIAAWDRYPTYPAYLQMMRDLAGRFPSLCRLDTVGYSAEGRLLLALKISDNVAKREDEPQCLYTSSMHGNELVGFVLLLRLADLLLNSYGQITPEGIRVTALVNALEIWIQPLFNPDGAYRLGGDTTVTNARRFNVNGVDLNRSFPDRLEDSVNTIAGREPETAAMMLWTRKHNFSLSANFHCGAQVVNYPWDNGSASGTPSTGPDDAWFIQLSLAYALPNPDLQAGGFFNGITNGCAWYSLFGGRQDWMYVWHGGREVTVELSNANLPPGSELPVFWDHNRESLLAYLEYALHGIRGLVTDAVTGEPVTARIDVLEIPGAPVFSAPAPGDYHRLLLAGTYTLVVQAEGYHPDTVRNVEVTSGAATRVDLSLRPVTATSVREEVAGPAGPVLLQNSPNPFNGSTEIRFITAEASRVTLGVFDLLGRRVDLLVDEVRLPGEHVVRFQADRHASGVYLLRLAVGKKVVSRRMVLAR